VLQLTPVIAQLVCGQLTCRVGWSGWRLHERSRSLRHRLRDCAALIRCAFGGRMGSPVKRRTLGMFPQVTSSLYLYVSKRIDTSLIVS
jgi:hypothetical protein